jgi:hypothetical protein
VLDVTQDLNNFFATYGPDLPRHNLNISGLVDLPWGFQVSALSSFLSHFPIAPRIEGMSNTGNLDSSNGGYTSFLVLMGGQYSSYLSKSELADLVSRYNSTVAGQLTPAGSVPGSRAGERYPTIALPSNYDLGDLFSSQDLRVTKTFKFKEKVDFRVIGEVFNIFNVSNVANFNFNLAGPATATPGTLAANPAFGVPNQRVGQTFGSGGPRAFQVALRLGF